MSVTVNIDGSDHRVARMDAHAVRVLMEAGALPFDGRVELVDGALIEMVPSNDPHSASIVDLIVALKLALGKRHRVLVDAAVYLANDLMLGPDLVVLRRPLISHESKGPDFDLVIEVSNTTLIQDLGWKAERYAQHGVPEYWVVDLPNEKLHVHRGPAADGYAEVASQDWDIAAEPQRLPGVSLILSELLDQ